MNAAETSVCNISQLLKNVHLGLPEPTTTGRSYLVRGDYTYFHYNCDGYNDKGWGCAYRTLQTLISWIIESRNDVNIGVPSVLEIQECLVSIKDKPQSFYGSHEWIGAIEVFYVIDKLLDVSCRIQHIPESENIKKYCNVIKQYFEDYGGLIMMGGDVDSSSKGIAGIHINGNDAYLLVLDPHYFGSLDSADELIKSGYVRWQHTAQFVDSSFYNLCLPRVFKNHR